jgi:hypothetical protein
MAARVAGTLTVLARDNSGVVPTVNNASTNGFSIAGGTSADLRKILIRVVNGTTAGTMTVRAPGNGVDANGNAQTSPYPSNAVFTQGGVGDLQATWSTTAGTLMLGPLTSDRFLQPDGNLYLDFSTATGVSFEVLQLPYNAV